MNGYELIARYVHAVTKRLPHRMRSDVRVELHALLVEEFEARTGSGTADGLVAEELLVNFGPPEKVALNYYTPSPVIDERDARIFGKTVAILLTSLTILAISVALSEPGANSDPAIPARIADEATKLGLQVLGLLLIVFWVAGFIRRRSRPATWSAKSLPSVPDPDAINRGLTLLYVLFWSLGLAVLAIGPADLMAMVMGNAAPQPLLDAFAYEPEFVAQRAPYLWFLLALSIATVAWQAIVGRKTRTMRIFNAIFTLVLSGVFFEIVVAGDVFAAEPANQYMKLAMALFGGWGIVEGVSVLLRERPYGRKTNIPAIDQAS